MWLSGSNVAYKMVEAGFKDGEVITKPDWTVYVGRGNTHTPDEANVLARKVAVLLKYGSRLADIVEALAIEGELQIATEDGLVTENPADLLTEMMIDLGLKDNETVSDALNV
jgi:hypothetical protein